VNAVVVASSDKAYGVHSELPYKESFCLKADHPYDVSKSCSDLIARMYFHTYGLKAAITRCGNIYGPGDFNLSRIVPDAICCAISGKTLLIRSDGGFIRDYVYVDDIIRGYMLLAQALQEDRFSGEAFNLSIESPITVIDLVSRIYALLGKEPNYRIMNVARHEIKRQYLSSAKARRQLGWCPRYPLDEGLKKTINWYKKAV
jgi:CDP-glucose 4,6-dehydratase